MKRITAFVMAILVLLPGFGYAGYVEPRKTKADVDFLGSILEIIELEYPFPADETKLIQGGAKGILKALDPNSDYYTKEEAQDLMEMTQGQIVGIGIVMEYVDGYLRVKEALEGYPAARLGLKPGDIIVAVDGVSVIGQTMSQISSSIKGEPNTSVEIRINRQGKLLDFKIKREKIKINSVHSRLLEEGLGYISLDEFNKGVSKDLDKILRDFDQAGVKKLVLDLRNNPGGLLTEAIGVAELLLPEGVIVHIRRNSGLETIRSDRFKKPKYELVALVNENSASASEIVAGAIKDRGLGKLVGTKTYGKGTVQNMFPITDGSILKLTVAEYLTPSKLSINKLGIMPDYEVYNDMNQDLQLKKAVELLK